MAEQKLLLLILDSGKPSQIGISLGPFSFLDRVSGCLRRA